jgi:cobalt-zinc-cadmium efflux system membrane fusion protein
MSVDASEMVQAEDDLITAVSSLHSTHAQLDLAQTNEKRQKQLLDIRGAALKDVQQSESDLATAEGNYRTAQITLAGARNKLRIFGVSDAEIARMESLGAAPKANPEALLRAPIDGTVILRQVGVGQFIQAAAANPVFSISNLSKVWLVANVREVDAPHIHLGDPVNVHVLALPGRVFRASISYVAPSVDPVTHRLLVRADVDNVDSLLKLQMFASFDIITGRDRPAPAIPTSAILYEGSTARVWVAGPKGGLGLRELRLGRTDGDQVEALAGVKAGDRVVVRGVIFIDRAASGETD